MVVDGESAVMRQCWRREAWKNKNVFTAGIRPFHRHDPIKSVVYGAHDRFLPEHCHLPRAPGKLCEAAALQRQNNTWVSPGASRTWSNLSFPLLTPPRRQAEEERKLSSGRGIKERRHTVKWSLGRRWHKTCKQNQKAQWCRSEEVVNEKIYHCYILKSPLDGAV